LNWERGKELKAERSKLKEEKKVGRESGKNFEF